MMQSIKTIEAALQKAGATLKDVVRTRIYLTDIAADSDAAGRAHGEVFGDIRPALAMVGVAKVTLSQAAGAA